MKTSILSILSILFAGLLLFDCSDEFLDLKPIAEENEETFFKSMTGADMATTACYAMFCEEKVWDLTIMMEMGSVASDEAEAGAGGKDDITEYQHIDQLRHTPATPKAFDWAWGYPYKSITYCNIAIEKFPQISRETDANYDPVLINKRLGEVKFLRAFNYFYLTQIFGGVPLVDHILLPSELERGRDEIYEIYDFIKKDLRAAINLLPTKSGWGDEVSRANKGAAEALLAKVYLFESSYAHYYNDDDRFDGLVEHWDSALYFAEQCMAHPDYELVGINGERFDTYRNPSTGGYEYIFMAEANNSKEEVFSIQARNDGLGWFYSRGTALTQWCGPRFVWMTRMTGTGFTSTMFGWGWWCPNDFLANSYEPGDPRKNASIIEKDVSDTVLVVDNDGAQKWLKIDWTELESETGLTRYSKKYNCSPIEFWATKTEWKEGPTNVKMIRFADVVLVAAEAAMMDNQNGKAIQYINLVRDRARASGDDPDVLPPLTGMIALDDIIQERLVELGLEGHRFFDLVRWNKAVEYLNHTLSNGDKIIFEKGKHEFFPIPNSEIVLSGGKLKQYEPWQ